MPIFVGAGTSSFMKGDGGVGFTRVTTTQRDAISGAVNGQVVLNTTTGVLEYYDGSAWTKVSAVPAKLNTVTGNIFAGSASTLTLAGEGFLTTSLVVRFVQSADSINSSVTVTPSSDTAATVAVPAAVYNNVTAGRVVEITVTNSDNSTSSPVNKTALALPSGGNITSSGGYRIHTFTSSGNFVNTIASLSTEWLLVAGGGGGGSGDDGAGGGSGAGAGGAIDSSATLNAGTYGVVIGGGGGGGNRNQSSQGANGSNSTFNGNTAIGGGRGVDDGNSNQNAVSGGSGGGGFRSGAGASGTSGQGTAGGNGGSAASGGAYAGGGGGGGKGGGGNSAGTQSGGNGGPGINWKSLGQFYAAGGGGGGDNGGSGGSGGSSIGGNGTSSGTQSNNSNHATANTGSGGGGTGASTGTFYRGSNGSGGIFIIRYQL